MAASTLLQRLQANRARRHKVVHLFPQPTQPEWVRRAKAHALASVDTTGSMYNGARVPAGDRGAA